MGSKFKVFLFNFEVSKWSTIIFETFSGGNWVAKKGQGFWIACDAIFANISIVV